MSGLIQSQEDVYTSFKKRLQQVFNMKFESERRRQYFDAFFNISNGCQEFKKELFSSEKNWDKKNATDLISSYFEIANYEICTQATQFFKEKGVQ
ncbi:hypothetical protein BCR24_06530 [Enterococcus ureilyticus]|uniref:Uncharacterized protein n=1 Tax=Enterococcus ureilyticus TaxID=1131292 RepID=A0A1E5H9L9_9ENTE|nr:hypothetical protein [Enterococcus ureilyticus]MBM7688424.1 hypothetical protein [Enterococcus ureilyticus]OEG21525.1 hypothetical protein BCR24_06530 [Enterococcus ureilyticus]